MEKTKTDTPVHGDFEKRMDWRTDKKLITFSFVKKYCPDRQYDKHTMIDRCPRIKRAPRAKLNALCASKTCPIWNELEYNQSLHQTPEAAAIEINQLLCWLLVQVS